MFLWFSSFALTEMLESSNLLTFNGLANSSSYDAFLMDEERGRLLVGAEDHIFSFDLVNINRDHKQVSGGTRRPLSEDTGTGQVRPEAGGTAGWRTELGGGVKAWAGGVPCFSLSSLQLLLTLLFVFRYSF